MYQQGDSCIDRLGVSTGGVYQQGAGGHINRGAGVYRHGAGGQVHQQGARRINRDRHIDKEQPDGGVSPTHPCFRQCSTPCDLAGLTGCEAVFHPHAALLPPFLLQGCKLILEIKYYV